MSSQSNKMVYTYKDFVEEGRKEVMELFPWDLSEKLNQKEDLILLDIRELDEFTAMRIPGSTHVSRGLLEAALSWGFVETIPWLVTAKEKDIVVICRSGNRSILAGVTMRRMGYQKVWSLKTGIRGWNDSELPLVDYNGNPVDMNYADQFLNRPPVANQREAVAQD